jgi:hypothetical protein
MVSIVKLTELTGIIDEMAEKGIQRSVSRPKYLGQLFGDTYLSAEIGIS